MLKKYLYLTIILFVTTNIKNVFSQERLKRTDKLYTMSSFGFPFPIGETNDYFKPKFSTALGVNLGLGNGGLFLFPKVSLHAFSFNEKTTDPGYTTALQKGRATTYLMNVAIGYRKIAGKFATYGFAGGGGGIILTPRITHSPSDQTATISNKSTTMPIIEFGLGTEYNIGGASLFIETSYMHGFNKIQDRTFNTLPIVVGIKPNLSKLFYK